VIICPNLACQTPNSVEHALCQACRTPLPHRYLWAITPHANQGANQDALNPAFKLKAGELLGNRYQQIQGQIFLDTKPGLIPESLAEFPTFVLPYLYLSTYPLAVPRPYALLQPDPGASGTLNETVLLLEEAALALNADGSPELLPTLADSWPQVTALRQLHWLLQIAQLWQPFVNEAVVSTLLDINKLRVNGSIVRVLMLQSDPAYPPTLADLGKAWQGLIPTAHKAISPFLKALCQHLQAQGFVNTETLLACLDRAIAMVGANQQVSYEAVVQTDQGPTRTRNEDACYPASGRVQYYEVGAKGGAGQPILLMVCDGIGGHEGGDVASKLAISTIEQRLIPLLQRGEADTLAIALAMEQAICAANDDISAQNDQESRYSRDRMGTTVVMALIVGPQIYVAHLGDSRAYRINERACRQITLDDDVAAREVRLGYGLYREVMEHPGSGALVQALGMGSSQNLYPTVQHFVLDEDCVFVLCSDGLSDNDRVEQFWQSELVPVLKGQQKVAISSSSLIQLANAYNGHDNVTVGLIYCRVDHDSEHSVPSDMANPSNYSLSQAQTLSPPMKVRETAPTILLPTSTRATRAKSQASLWPLLMGITALIALGAGLIALLGISSQPRTTSVGVGTSDQMPSTPGLSSVPLSGQATPAPSASPGDAIPGPIPGQIQASLDSGSFAKVRLDNATEPLMLFATPDRAGALDPGAVLTDGSVVQILSQQQLANNERWIRLRTCSVGQPNSGAPTNTVQPVLRDGWILAAQLAPVAYAVDSATSPDLGACLPKSQG
jgi:serine/threonine protein phosphatase PrpC